jgi:NAD(P)-dependent dehydrogenase (short-subunit alcohol dehydrogenase family)
MTHVVITGAARGIGFGLAQSFLTAGCRVTIGARDAETVRRAVSELAGVGAAERVAGTACDVTDPVQLQALWDFAQALAPVEIWINNAGKNTAPRPLWELDADAISAVVTTNLLGVALGTRVALRGMIPRAQGKIYNLEGFGADGSKLDGFAAYGTSKAGVRYLSRALAREARRTGVLVATVDPGVVTTGMLKLVYSTGGFGSFSNVALGLAEPVEVIAPRLVRAMLSNQRSGKCIRASGPLRLLWALLRAPFRKERNRLLLSRL